MNEAVQILSAQFGFGDHQVPRDGFANSLGDDVAPSAHIHPDTQFSLFGPSGTKEKLQGRHVIFAFVTGCAAALAEREDEIGSITPIDEQGAFFCAGARRESRANGEESRYDWAMLYRVENGMVTYGTDTLDTDAQAFRARVMKGAA